MKFILNFIGGLCALSLLLAIAVFAPGAIHGDFRLIREFFQYYPGIEPFIVFVFPVIVIGGGAWLWRWIRNLVQHSKENRY